MARKKKSNEPKALTAAQYWEWRCTSEELKSAKLNEKRVHLEQEIRNKEIEARRLQLALFKETVKASRRAVEIAEAEYEKFRQRLEEELDIDLKDCVIDENTFEVKSVNNLHSNIDE